MRRLLTALAAGAAALLCGAPGAAAQAPPAPSLAADVAFAPPTGVARGDFTSGTVADIPAAVAVHGDRIYTVGRTQGGGGGQDIGILAHRLDGTLDPAFSGDGKLIVSIAPGTEPDIGTGIVVLPDGRLRVVGATDAVAGAGESLDVAIVGLHPDGSPDTGFGAAATDGTRTGRIVFPAGPSSDVPARVVAGPDGRLAIVGARSDGARDDLFVSLREPDGSPVAGFGTDGVRVLNRGGAAGGTSLVDRGVDVEFRPGGGIVALALVETDPGAGTSYAAVLHAFRLDGQDDPAFSDDGDLVLAVGEPDTVPGGLLVHRGRLWVTGSTRMGADTDAFLARVDADGGGLQFRRFDMRGRVVTSAQVVSRALDLAVVGGDPETLVTVGSVDHGAEGASTSTDWAAAAFNNLDGDLSQAGVGDIVLQAPGQGGLLSVAAGGDRWLAVAGAHIDTTMADNSFGTARLLVDADKVCDLAVSVAPPAELVFEALRPAALRAQVTNVGARACGGVVGVAAPYEMAPVATGRVAPGQTAVVGPAPVRFAGARRAEDVLAVTVRAAEDANTANDRASAHVVFQYCDVALRAVGRPGAVPDEGTRRFDVMLRNRGTAACRVRVGGGRPYLIAPGRSAADRILALAPKGARVGSRARIVLRADAEDDITPADNTATVVSMVVGVGDSRIARRGASLIAGTATAGRGRLARRALRPTAVDVALVRLGGGRCGWLRSARGGLITRRATDGRGCGAPPRWIRARGTRTWRLALRGRLPAGSYVAYSRVRIGAGFVEDRFSARDGNRIAFIVR